jgi:hypothetical protein
VEVVYWFNNMHGRNNVKLAMFTAICNFRIAKQRKKCKITKEFRCKKRLVAVKCYFFLHTCLHIIYFSKINLHYKFVQCQVAHIHTKNYFDSWKETRDRRLRFIAVQNEMSHWLEIWDSGEHSMNVSQKETMDLSTPPIKIPLSL